MACPLVTTGDRFLAQTLGHLDCQAQTIGSFGFQSLGSPGSPASLVLTALLTLFVALFAVRLLFGSRVEPRDGVLAVLKVGIVLTLALSWPAFRTLAYDTVLKGPAEIAAAISPSSVPASGAGFAERLQTVDRAMAALTASGTGRQTGSLALETGPQPYRSIALPDETGFGWARTIYLGSVIGSLAVLRVGGGLLLALAPLFAGLLLFELTRGLFVGWLRGLVLVALGSLGITLLLAVEVAVLEPWLADALNRRTLGYATPAAPTELLAMTLAFALASAGLMFLLGKVAFQNASQRLSEWRINETQGSAIRATEASPILIGHTQIPVHSRALAVSESVTAVMRREDHVLEGGGGVRRIEALQRPETGAAPSVQRYSPEPLGSQYRRNARRETGSHSRRDERS